jgi:hypothetical protein
MSAVLRASVSSHRSFETHVYDMTAEEHQPSDFDVASGRGKHKWDSPGNLRFKAIVYQSLQSYFEANSTSEKTRIVKGVVASIRNSGSRFMRKTPQIGGWRELTFREACTKVAHAIRDYMNRSDFSESPKKEASPTSTKNESMQHYDITRNRLVTKTGNNSAKKKLLKAPEKECTKSNPKLAYSIDPTLCVASSRCMMADAVLRVINTEQVGSEVTMSSSNSALLSSKRCTPPLFSEEMYFLSSVGDFRLRTPTAYHVADLENHNVAVDAVPSWRDTASNMTRQTLVSDHLPSTCAETWKIPERSATTTTAGLPQDEPTINSPTNPTAQNRKEQFASSNNPNQYHSLTNLIKSAAGGDTAYSNSLNTSLVSPIPLYHNTSRTEQSFLMMAPPTSGHFQQVDRSSFSDVSTSSAPSVDTFDEWINASLSTQPGSDDSSRQTCDFLEPHTLLPPPSEDPPLQKER